MSKDAFYFKHDANARNDEKILELRAEFGWEGYGLYWALIETLREAPEYRLKASLLNGQAVSLGIPKSKLIALIDFCVSIDLLSKDDEAIWSESLCRRMADWDNKKAMFAEAGRKGAEKRWPNKGITPDKDPVNSPPIHHPNSPPINGGNSYKIREDKRKEEKIREEEKEPPISPLQGDASDLKKNKGGDEKVHRLEIGPTFEDFWEAYDKKRGSKEKVSKQWNAMSLKDKQTAMAMLPAYIASTPDKKFRKDPERYISNRVWEFEDLKEPQTVPLNQQNFNQNAGQRRSMDGLKEAWGRRIASR